MNNNINNIIENVVINIKGIFRKNKLLNTLENDSLTNEFYKTVKSIKEKNSQALFNKYYLPRAVKEILSRDKYLTTNKQAFHLAVAMLNKDIADGKLNEFYKFI